MTAEKQQIRAIAKGSLISEYIITWKASSNHAPTINTKDMERQLRACSKWMRNIEARTRQYVDGFKITWSTISPELMLHYFLHLEKKADRHSERMARNEETMQLLIDFYDWLNFEYGNQKLLNVAAVARLQFRQDKRKTA